MSDRVSPASPAVVEALKERLRVVQEISRLNARHLLNRQACGGAEFEILQVEREIETAGESKLRAAALEGARERRQRATAAMADCDVELAALDLRLADLDRRIAAG